MKTRIVTMISMLCVSVLASAVAINAQQSTTEPTRATTARPAKASTPPVLPTQPNLPNLPNLPNVPNVPNVPNLPDDPLADVLFPPDLIMRHARELELTSEQKTFMRGEIQQTTTQFNDLQWQLLDAMEALRDAMKSSSLNEQQVMTQLDKVLDTERVIKHLHIRLGVRLKNHLTPQQQAKLQGMRANRGA